MEEAKIDHFFSPDILNSIRQRVVHHARLEERFDQVIDAETLFVIIRELPCFFPRIRLVRAGEEIELSEYTESIKFQNGVLEAKIDSDKVLESYHQKKATIIMYGLEEFWKPATEFVEALRQKLGREGIRMNVYFTPKETYGLDAHEDVHDILVIQLAGEKRWTVKEHEIIQTKGDFLFLPKGTLHQARTEDQASVHLSISIW